MRYITPLLLCLAACSTPPVVHPPEVDLRQAHTEFLQGNYSRAAHLYEQALPHVGEAQRSEVLARMGACRLGAGDPDGALRTLEEALSAGPSRELEAEIRYRRAAAFNACYRPAEALSELSRVRALPESVRGSAVRSEEFCYRLAVTAIRSGDWKTGRALLNEVVIKYPNSREANDAKDRLGLSEFRVQIARVRTPGTKEGEAVKSVAGDYLVLVGRFHRFPEAVSEMERLRRGGHLDAFVVP